ncbi:MAG: hypothetical protein ACE145_02170 [Terriglobia bacterium]
MKIAGALLLVGALVPTASAAGLELVATREYLRPDPFGSVVAQDSSPEDLRRGTFEARKGVVLQALRGGYVSFHLSARLSRPGSYSLNVTVADRAGKIQSDVFREWFHLVDADGRYYPDALVPVALPYHSELPEPDNRIPRQTAQAFWVDVWIPSDAAPGTYRGRATVESGKARAALPIEIQVLAARIPPEDAITLDHNSYGSSWLGVLYPRLRDRLGKRFYQSDEFFSLIHAYHRLFYEHRGVYHQLGYGHGGKVGPEFAPVLAGSGRAKHIADWTLFDRHYGPLLDGSAFAQTRRGPKAIPYVYLPINPEWPASFLWWGEPGYEVEFVNVVSEIERHFREKGWTRTYLEMIFNQKKRYKAFPWDGDEVRFARDNEYYLEYGRLLKKALPADTPVKFVFRADVSWMMEDQFKLLAGVAKSWVCNSAILSWYREAPSTLRERGDIIWYYSAAPSVQEVSSAITFHPLRAWMWGVHGYLHWQTVEPGEDPWFHFNGGSIVLAYPGERFGIEGPIPSLRLKIQRNALQDLAVLSGLTNGPGAEGVKAEVARLYNGTRPEDWWNPRPAMASLPPPEWSDSIFDQADRASTKALKDLRPSAWQSVRDYALQRASEAK